MSDIVVSVGKSAWHSIFHNHTEHREIALKIDNLEKKNEDFRELSRKIDKLSEGFFELKGGIDTNFKMYDTKFDKLEKTIEDLEPTISVLKKYLKDKNYL